MKESRNKVSVHVGGHKLDKKGVLSLNKVNTIHCTFKFLLKHIVKHFLAFMKTFMYVHLHASYMITDHSLSIFNRHVFGGSGGHLFFAGDIFT